MLTDAAPAATFHTDGLLWLAVKEKGTGKIKCTRVSGSAPEPWQVVGSGGAVEPWLTAPALVSNGSRVEAFVAKVGFPQIVYQALHEGGWGTWRPLTSEAGSTLQPATATVNGEVELVTWFYGLAEQEVE